MSQALLLRTCNPDRTSSSYRLVNGQQTNADPFTWPAAGPVACTDWDPNPVCGGGLHGLLYGEGSAFCLSWNPDDLWLVFAADPDSVVIIDGDKAKVPAAEVLFCGDRLGATTFLNEHAPGHVIHGITLTGGDRATLSALYWDGSLYRRRMAEVGENGIKAGVPYRLNKRGEFVEVK